MKFKYVPSGALVFSEHYFDQHKVWSKHILIFSTQKKDSLINILRTYKKRWAIEVMHMDLKQNLGFNKAMIRSKTGVVRHSIISIFVYVVLQLFMAQYNLDMTVGECITYLRENTIDNFIKEIVEIEDKNKRMEVFER